MAYKHFPSKRGIRRKREIDKETIGTNLYVADRRILDEEVGRKKSTRSAVLREVFHQYAMKKRLAPGAPEGAQETALMALQKKTAAELAEARREIADLLNEVRESRRFQEGVSELNGSELKHAAALSSAHYNVSAQTFAAIWALIHFVQCYSVDPLFAASAQVHGDAHAESVKQRDLAREIGLEMVGQMSDEFGSPVPVQIRLFDPCVEPGINPDNIPRA
jgi:hypothetical protein